jgi:glycerophosphoryl diester phosphodiesterase
MRLLPFFTLSVALAVLHPTSGYADLSEAAVGVTQIVAHRGASTERPECTVPALQQAIEVGATVVEIDVRTSKDGVLFLLHDATLDRTTNGTGAASEKTISQLKLLDAGSSFDAKYQNEKIPTLREALELCRDQIDVLLDLKEQGDSYAQSVASDVRRYGDPKRTIIGVRSVDQARQFRTLLPTSRQLGFIPNPESIESFAKAGVETIRLWPRWLADETLVPKVRQLGVRLHLNGATGLPQEVLPLLKYHPDSLLADDPATLVATLNELRSGGAASARLDALGVSVDSETVVPAISGLNAVTFSNRDYRMMEMPRELVGQPKYLFDGGAGDRVSLKFKNRTVLFAAFEYNDTGAWSFPDGRTPTDFGWRLLAKDAYRGTSNATLDNKPHYASIYYCEFDAGQQLSNQPPWWVCLAVMSQAEAAKIPGFELGTSGPISVKTPFSYEQWATKVLPLAAPQFVNDQQWANWQEQQRQAFRSRLVFPYKGETTIVASGDSEDRGKFIQQEYEVHSEGERIFRFYQLEPKAPSSQTLPTIVCFMGHGKVSQILEQRESYQHACAAQFAERGYLVFAMENVGMEPGRDTHHELDWLLRLDGYCWYSLLFAHQQILLDHVFADEKVATTRVGVTGVSTGGLLALSAAALEPRIAATSVQGIFGSMRVSFIRDRNRHCRCGAIPGLLPDFDLPELAMLVTPRAIHFSNPDNDGFGPAEAKRCVELITPPYQEAGGPIPEFSQPAGSHEYAFEAAADFFERTLRRTKP